jgi:2-dehydro-3-deoxyphosphogluconate aldolase / (4S)-4-hydroxy-2-oxoglutarate aldolase
MGLKQEAISALRETGIVAVIRTESPKDLAAVARALAEGDVRFIEITMTVPRALDVIRDAVAQLGRADVYIGAGTVLDAATARAAILAGSRFVVGPGFDPGVVEICSLYGIPCMPGALTPQEVITAWKGGADVVKIFPADLGGPAYLKALKEPLPQVELLPTKGVDMTTAGAFIKAGAIAVGTGTALVSKAMMASGDYAAITENARRMRAIVREARGGGA